jgi:hypothetical protein
MARRVVSPRPSGNVITVEGAHHAMGRTFTCTGKVSYDLFKLETWSCSACDGELCGSCAIDVTGDCNL